VIVAEAWPSWAWTALTLAPWAISRLAADDAAILDGGRQDLGQHLVRVADARGGRATLDQAGDPLPNGEHVDGGQRRPLEGRHDLPLRVLLQRTDDVKASKERMHLDLETDDEAEVKRLEALGATRYDHQQERGYDFWVLRDPWGDEFCVLQPEFPGLLARRRPWRA
jgi:hypothetical protein